MSTYQYDALNRNRIVDFSDTTTINPDVKRFYDGATNGKGRFWYNYRGGDYFTGSNVEHTAIDSYDALGRPLVQRQLFKINSVWGPTYQTSRGYNLAGAVTSQIYPSNRSVSYSYDAAGRTSSFSGNLGDNTNRTYATGIIYSSLGGMSKEQFGTATTPIYNKMYYNNRGQLAEIRVGTTYTGPTDTGWERGAIINHYSAQCWGACSPTSSMTDNNGNLRQQDHWINDGSGGVAGLFVQNYDYDNLNRLLRVREGTTWQQEFFYDRWGNRTIHQTNTWGDGINKKPFNVSASNNNRLEVPAGQLGTMTYDAAGNLINDTYSGAGTRVYDAENKMTQAQDSYSTSYYTYNADGHRTRRKINGQETWQIYGFDGELLAEYPANGAAGVPQKEYGYRNGQLLVTTTAPVGTGTGLQGQYFDNMNFTDLKVTRTDTTVNFDWGGGSPQSSIAADTFTARWTGRVEPQYTQTYTFYTTTDDGVRLWVNGQLLIDKWIDQGPTEWSGQIALTAGQRYDIRMDFYENGGGATAKLSWSSASQPKQIIPQNRLYLPGASSQVTVNWLVADQLGTPRIVLDQTGSLANVKRHDYLPFGEELYAGIGGRTPALGYSPDNVRQQFTQKERDNETGLDFFEARYYASTQGRFTSVDPLMASARVTRPQSWNRYTYAYNNPFKFVDPDGMDVKFLNDQATQYVLNTLPEKIRARVKSKIGKDGVLKKGALDKIKSNDQNFKDLKELVNLKKTTEVTTDTGSYQEGTRIDFYYKTAEETRKEFVEAYVKLGNSREEAEQLAAQIEHRDECTCGHTQTSMESPSGNVRVVVSDGTGEAANMPLEMRVGTTGHELYVHALLMQRGKPHGHGDTGGPTESQFHDAYSRSVNNFKGQQKQSTPTGVKPKN